MRNWKKSLAVFQAVLFVLCAANSICTILGVPFTQTGINVIVGNTLAAVFFVPMALSLIFAWKEWEEGPVKLVRNASLVVLLGSILSLILLHLVTIWGAPSFFQGLLAVIFMLLNLATLNCSLSIWILPVPIFAWAVLMVSSFMMLRRMHGK